MVLRLLAPGVDSRGQTDVKTLLAQYCKQERLRLKLTLGDAARLAGYSNLSKGVRHIGEFEKTGSIDDTLLQKLVVALSLDADCVRDLAREDQRRYLLAWNRWANQKVDPYVVVRLIPAIYQHVPLPAELSVIEDAEDYVSRYAREWKLRCCLVWSRRLSVYFAADGSVESRQEAAPGQSNAPTARIFGNGEDFCLDEDGNIKSNDEQDLGPNSPE